MVETLRVGMVGLGLVATSHLKGYLSHPRAAVVAICDLDQARALRFAEENGIEEVYADYGDMLNEADLDVVDIATPTHLHAPMALEAVRAGKHVHCEKPFCRFVGEGEAVCRAATLSGVRVVVGETYVFISSHQKARALIEAGEIGRPLQIRQRHGDWIERAKARVYTGPPDRGAAPIRGFSITRCISLPPPSTSLSMRPSPRSTPSKPPAEPVAAARRTILMRRLRSIFR